ncbi:hypothetical protein QBC46DRAFT_366858 [Diplogelasinospora grovesii]|uniref:Uncharacterized protein n=1 Tax=Diplogelasinospora grovesii TaxID=303347 RepID=A0AAN6S0D1_9PEZI|nr:hypothetical protein QBC46DRAFT_366858 [Diplogelasinospora grovesii]
MPEIYTFYAEYAIRVLNKAKNSGRLSDRSTIDPHTVRRGLKKRSKEGYFRVYAVWQYPGSDPRDMQTMKHFAEVLRLGIEHKLDKEAEMLNIRSLRGIMRRFYNQWEREHHTTIDEAIKESVCPYIIYHLAEKLSLFTKIKKQTFITLISYAYIHDYRHEGSRVDASNLLNTHCYTSARLQEVCGAKYQDIICLVRWKDGEPEIKMDFKREICKGLDYKKPEHPFTKKLADEKGIPPPLFS